MARQRLARRPAVVTGLAADKPTDHTHPSVTPRTDTAHTNP